MENITINGGNVTARGGYATNAGRHPGAGIGCGGGGAKAVEGGYKYGDIAIHGGTVSAIAYQNEVYAIGIAVKPESTLSGTLYGSISISDQAVVNLNGGDYFPKSDHFGLKNYTIQCTIDDGRLTESTYPVTISVGDITWDAGMMSVSGYHGTFTASNYLKPSADEREVVVKVGDTYVYQMGSAAFNEDETAPITLTKGIPLYETRLKFVSMAINRFDDPLEVSEITIKQDNAELVNEENDIAKLVLPSQTISYGGDNNGYLTVYLPANAGQTEISVTVPQLNDGQPIVKSDLTISAPGPNEIEMYAEDTSCKHESFDADGFCEKCKDGYQPATLNEEGVYEIRNAGQLFWFAEQFNNNKIDQNSSLKLMKDIEIPDGRNWVRMGSSNQPFYGNIDGNYHVISGLRTADWGTQGIVSTIVNGSVMDLGLILEDNAWYSGLCYKATNSNIENCFTIRENGSGNFYFIYAVDSGTEVKNCMIAQDSSCMARDSYGTFTNCYQTGSYKQFSGITIVTKDQLESGEIAYHLNVDNNVVWGQDIGTDDYPQFVKYSKRVYRKEQTGGTYKYYNIASGGIASATVTNITTNSATIQVKLTSEATDYYFWLYWMQGDHTAAEVNEDGEHMDLESEDSEEYEILLTGLRPGTTYRYSLNILNLEDVTYVDFQTQQAAPTEDAVSIDYERETLKNVSDVSLEYAESEDVSSWTPILKNAQVSLTNMLNGMTDGGSKTLYIRKKASSSGPVSEAISVTIPGRPAIADNQKPVISYTNETIKVSDGIEYQIGTTEPTYWASAKKGNGTAVTITNHIPSYGTSADKVYYRVAASNTDEHFASKTANIEIPARPETPNAISTDQITVTSKQITLDDSTSASTYEYGIRSAESTGTTFTWQSSAVFSNLQPAHGYEITRRTKAVEASGNTPGQFASEPGTSIDVVTKDVLRVIGNGDTKWVTTGTYGDSLDKISVSLASGYGVYDSSNQQVTGSWQFADSQSSDGGSKNASAIYPNVTDTQGYTVIFVPSGTSDPYDSDAALSDTVIPAIAKKEVNVSVNVAPRAYSGDTTAVVPSPLKIGTGVNTGSGEEELQITGLTGSFVDANAGTNKKILLDSSNVMITGVNGSDPDNYQVIIPAETTGDITTVQASISIGSEWPAQKTYGDASFPLSGVTLTGDGKVTYHSSNKNVLTVDENGQVTIHGIGEALVTIRMETGTNYTANQDARWITVQKGTISLNLTARKKTGLLQRLRGILGNVEDTYVLTLEAKGAYEDELTGTVTFYEKGQPLNQAPISLTDGSASMEYSNLAVGEYEISADYTLSSSGAENDNYNQPASATCRFEVGKADENKVQIKEVNGKIYGDEPFALEITGQKGTGAVKFSVPAGNGVLELSEVNGNTEAKIIGAGTVLVMAEVAGDEKYNGTTVTREMTIGKAQAPEVTVAEPKIAPVPADAPAEVKEIADLFTRKSPEITGLDTAAKDLIQEAANGDVIVKTGENQTISGAEAKKKLQEAGIDTTGKKVRLVVEPYMSVEIKGVSEKQGMSVITFEITALYNVKATTDGKNENTILIGSAIPQKVGTPVTITLPLPADYPTEDLFIRHLLHNGGVAYYPVTVRKTFGNVMAEFVNKDGFSTFELLTDSRKGTITYDNGIGDRSYTLEQMNETLPTVSKDGYAFKGWKINGILYTTVSEELLDVLDQAEGHHVSAQAVLEKIGSGTSGGQSGSQTGGNSSGSGSTSRSTRSTGRDTERNTWTSKKVNGITRWRYYGSDGRCVYNTWKQLSYNGTLSWYHFGADGYMDTGWFVDTDGRWYYLNPVSDGTQGAMKTGWLTDPQDSHRYYLDPKTGAMVTGKVQIDGVWYYFNEKSSTEPGWSYSQTEKMWIYVNKKQKPLGMLEEN